MREIPVRQDARRVKVESPGWSRSAAWRRSSRKSQHAHSPDSTRDRMASTARGASQEHRSSAAQQIRSQPLRSRFAQCRGDACHLTRPRVDPAEWPMDKCPRARDDWRSALKPAISSPFLVLRGSCRRRAPRYRFRNSGSSGFPRRRARQPASHWPWRFAFSTARASVPGRSGP